MPNILVVDDQPHIQELLMAELRCEGYEFSMVSDVESLNKYLSNTRPELVLLDLYLDGFKGWEVLGDIKKRQPGVPVLILTAYDSFKEDKRLRQADGYIIKNYSGLDSLKKKIADVLGG